MCLQLPFGHHEKRRYKGPETPKDIRQLVATKADCRITSCFLCLGQKAALEHTAETAAKGQLLERKYHQKAAEKDRLVPTARETSQTKGHRHSPATPTLVHGGASRPLLKSVLILRQRLDVLYNPIMSIYLGSDKSRNIAVRLHTCSRLKYDSASLKKADVG